MVSEQDLVQTADKGTQTIQVDVHVGMSYPRGQRRVLLGLRGSSLPGSGERRVYVLPTGQVQHMASSSTLASKNGAGHRSV